MMVEPASVAGDITVTLEDDIVVKPPRRPRGSSIFYAGEGNVLQRTDPRQEELKLPELLPPGEQTKAV